uniref:Uncharacterized protein n=1 Tax=Phlebotomus papatasi TaxID=29031 RepID=A0A1B0D4J8_PHLPP
MNVEELLTEDAVHITAILGESVVFNCHVEFPGDHPVPYVLQWEKKVSETGCASKSSLHNRLISSLVRHILNHNDEIYFSMIVPCRIQVISGENGNLLVVHGFEYVTSKIQGEDVVLYV